MVCLFVVFHRKDIKSLLLCVRQGACLRLLIVEPGDIRRMARTARAPRPKIKTPPGRFNFWLTIVNELRTTYYADIMNIATEFEKLNKTTNDLCFDDN